MNCYVVRRIVFLSFFKSLDPKSNINALHNLQAYACVISCVNRHHKGEDFD